jgi:membrane protease YdiL (CAAX protease family)
MTLAAWTAWRILGSPTHPTGAIYWFGIVAAALVFALAHLPFLYGVIGEPPLWLPIAAIVVNGITGTVFGWLFWRQGLEAAMMAHALAHVTAVLAGLAVA